ncbi:MAG: fused MFS/spermidine synthase [Candidatus Aminicenantes bacterium]|nr:fused MFS/spermidine synthase [Candidatus Aminicenantes bacterium]
MPDDPIPAETNPNPAAGLSATRRFLPVLLLLFAGSGCAALIFEIVWLQLLQLTIGSTAVSMAVLLGTYMGGMCLGSIALPRLISPRRHPFRVYASLELGIGLIGIVVLIAMPVIVRLYTANAGHGFGGILLRGLVSALCLLPPTVLMGATLPALARWLETTPQGVSWLGFLYAGNTAGAVLGCLLAGFYLLRVHDMTTATFVAAAINGTVALISVVLARRASHRPQTGAEGPVSAVRTPGTWPIYVTIAVSGLCALGAEVVWTRLLSLMMGATVYTFSIILAVFLAGLGLGSGAGSFLARKKLSPRLALGICQLLLAAGIAWTAYMIARSLPFWPVNPALTKGPWLSFQFDLVRCLWAILPAAVLWGASFPLALAAAASPGQDGGRLVGRVYAANTIGAIVGSIAFSLVLIPTIGTHQSERVLIGLSAAAALLALAPIVNKSPAGVLPESAHPNPGIRIGGLAALSGTVVLGVFLVLSTPAVPWELIAFGRYLPTRTEKSTLLYFGEGMNSSVAVTELESGVRNFHVSGRVEASSSAQDMRMERMLGHVPALLHPKPESVLIVGCGAGITAGTFVLYPSVKRIVICEIEPLIPKVVARFFGQENYDVLDDPRVQVVYDDARHFVLTTKEKFDVITSDPIHPWIKGSASLYTKEYYHMVKRHLNPGGVIAQWVPLYESTVATVKSEIATFFDVFPGGTIWSNDFNGQGYDVVLLGRDEETAIDLDELQQRLDRGDHQAVALSIKELGLGTAADVLSTYAGRASDLTAWLKNAELNRDRNLRLQYLAGMGLNSYQSGIIFDQIVSLRRFPNDLILGSEKSLAVLWKLMGLIK